MTFSFALFDRQFRLSDGFSESDGIYEIGEKLKSYESRRWSEFTQSKKRDHSVPVHRLITDARKRLVELRQDDLDELWRFRFGAKQRLWGIRRGSRFLVLWWDPEHMVCPSQKKHT